MMSKTSQPTPTLKKKKNKIIIGIDPGYDRLGIAVIEKQNPKEILVFSDCIQTSKTIPFSERLLKIGQEVKLIIGKYKPDLIAVEKVFVTNNQKTAMLVGEVKGVLMYLSAELQIPLVEYTPPEIKATITGNGQADKKQIISMVKNLIKLERNIQLDDEYDAIAIALTASAKNNL